MKRGFERSGSRARKLRAAALNSQRRGALSESHIGVKDRDTHSGWSSWAPEGKRELRMQAQMGGVQQGGKQQGDKGGDRSGGHREGK
eukprot:4228268-Pleurochrysis_carterae.AAC.3